MALIKKISVSNVTYDLGADAVNIDYDSDDTVKDKIDGYDEIIPSSASSSNKLATMNDIPSLTNYIEKSQTAGLVKNDGSIDTNTYLTSVPTATSSALGLVKPDNSTITVDANGTITSTATGGGCVKKRYTITAANWSNSVDADGYYTYTVTLSNPTLDTSYAPEVLCSSSDGQSIATVAQKEAYSKLEEVILTSSSSLTLYATEKPETDFYVWIKGQAV